MNTQSKIISAVVVLILMGGSFWGGITYAKAHPTRGQFNTQFGGAAGGRAGGFGRGGMGGASVGQVVSADKTTMTIKLASGSTQIVLFSTSTQIMKSVAGTASDLSAGTNVIIMGQPNSDGSLTAQSVQIRPAVNR